MLDHQVTSARRSPRRWTNSRIAACIIVLSSVAMVERGLVAAAKSPASSLRAQATRLFRAKRFAEACPKFQAAVQLSPSDPGLLLDLALCDQRINALDAARKLNEQVIQIESAPSLLMDSKAAGNRRHAYYNLAQASVEPVGAGKNGEVVCFPLGQAGGCTKSLFACAVNREDGWAARLVSATVIRIAAGKEAAALDPPDAPDPSFSVASEKSDPLPIKIKHGDGVTYLERWGGRATRRLGGHER